MNAILIILLVLAMGATAYVLVRGVMAMASGKDISGERQQDYMRKRVLFQAVAIVIVILLLVVAGVTRARVDLHAHG
jgi:Hypoxia induced protein conserved region